MPEESSDTTAAKRRDHPRRRSRRRKKPGTAPGAIVVDPAAPPPVMRIMAFNERDLKEGPLEDVSALKRYREAWPIVWLDIEGFGNAATISAIGETFGLHPLALEDAVTPDQRAKSESYPDHEFVVLRMVNYDTCFTSEQIGILFGKGFVVTFQEHHGGDCLNPVRERIRAGLRRDQFLRSDYLAYALIDAIVDGYFPVLERMGDALEHLEDTILQSADSAALERLHATKRDFMHVRKAIWPTREALGLLYREDRPLVHADTRIYLRDCYDHAVQIIDVCESYRDVLSGLMDLYLSMTSFRMNETMRVLTVIATIFMPLTFVVGVYGMNFNTQASRFNMPELNWPFGYPLILAVMAGIGGGFWYYFRRKGWV